MGLISNGTTLLDAGALDSGVATGSMTLLSTLTANDTATLDFTSGINSTYKEYIFKFINIHPSTNDEDLTFQVDTGTNTNYNQTITSTAFQVFHGEDGNNGALAYKADRDQIQATAFQPICQDIGNGNDESGSGHLHLFNPSSSSFVKHFVGLVTNVYSGDAAIQIYSAGYINTATAITRIRFKMSSGNFDQGIIKMYGVI
jgi:hypothetical protein